MPDLTNLLLLKVADALDGSPRLGDDEDDPEGSRYIQISDSLARLLADACRSLAGEVSDAEFADRFRLIVVPQEAAISGSVPIFDHSSGRWSGDEGEGIAELGDAGDA